MNATPVFNTASTAPYEYNLLTEKDIPAFLALLKAAQEDLTDKEKHFLKNRTAKDLADHLNNGFPIIGIWKEGKLAAQAILTPVQDMGKTTNLDGYPLDLMQPGHAVIQTVSVHPDHKGNGVGRAILQAAHDTARDMGFSSLVAKVATDNTGSQRCFEKAGYEIAGRGMDPVKHYPCYYMARAVTNDVDPMAVPAQNVALRNFVIAG